MADNEDAEPWDAWERKASVGIAISIGCLAVILIVVWFIRARKRMVVWAHKPLKEHFQKPPHFWPIEVASILCGCYSLTVTFTYVGQLGVFGGVRNPESGLIDGCAAPCETTLAGVYNYTTFLYPSVTSTQHVVTRQVVAFNTYQEVLLGISRFSGFALYPWIIMVFFTKFRGIQAFLNKTPLNEFLIQDTHHLHVVAGWYIFYDSLVHTTCHCLRWLDQGNINLLWSTPYNSNPSGLTGLLCVIVTFIIVFPMTVLKKHIKFEMRKYAHYSFWIYCLLLTWHAPWWAWPNAGWCKIVFPSIMIIYFLDATYVKFYMTERIDTVAYRQLESGVEVCMPVSDRFQSYLSSGGYGYVMFPWVSKHQWHAFSLYENPLDKSIRNIFMANIGDWTKEMHTLTGMSSTARPLWISGPFPSPYSNAFAYDNMICVASGIGITPAISAIEAYRESRRVNLVWACRDASMLVFFLENAKLDEKGFNLIFYTGKDPLPETIQNFNTSNTAHLKIIKARPKLRNVIPNIVRTVDEYKDTLKPQFAEVMVGSNPKEAPKEAPSPSNAKTSSESQPSPISEGKEEGKEEEEGVEELGKVTSQPSTKAEMARSGKVIIRTSQESCVTYNRKNSVLFGIEHHRASGGVKRSMASSIWKTSLEDVEDKEILPLVAGGSSAFELAGEIPADRLKVWEESSDARDYVKSKMAPANLKTWGLLYCGGRNPLLSDLLEQSKDLGIPLQEEAFDW